MTQAEFQVAPITYDTGLAELRAVREPVFVTEQGVPLELEWDELDPTCHHVIARDTDGHPIGTGRLTPERRIGRMAVLPAWRGKGVGDALLAALLDEARKLGWREITLHAQVSAINFYARHGFLPYGPRYDEAGIEHQSMRLLLDHANPVETRDQALAAMLGVVSGTRRQLVIYSRDLDPGLLDHPDLVDTLKQLATRRGEIRILLQDPTAPQRAHAPLLALAQRLPSAFQFRAIDEPCDQSYAAAYAANDAGGWYFRTLGHRFDGETRLNDRARARQLEAMFEPVWERARPCSEFRALGI
ncbi:GNAT family N-acetyltransferase [Aerolutibacter ruishenii]|uniref:Putative GNAT family N-acyltransferase n=1 Tax=Aerolutibacter ruishenii TaxID=686800 RepID=A0A562LYF5_9GAMM|nr:GNAT family N-acetyltransferase [Lysobacter ruishenii]TWI12656.1 putative GNAT family N-acyltransferase [Lysobacter ruishenii]